MSGANKKRGRPTVGESERIFRAIFEQTAVGVAQIVSETGAFVRINRRYAEFVGYTVPEMEQLTFQAITHPADLPEDLDNMRRLLAGEIREFSREKRYYHKDGSIVWGNLTVSPMWRVGEPPDHHIAIVEDITDRKRAEIRLEEERDFAESLIHTANAIVVVLDAKGNIRVFNEAAEKITGYNADEISSKNWFETLVPRERFPAVWDEFGRLLAGGVPKEFENPILTKGGEVRHIVWKNSELIRDGQVTGTVSFGIDITAHKRAEQEREKLIARLEAQNAELERFTYTVSHDLKSPLITIKGYLGILSEDLAETDAEFVREDLARISNAADKMGHLLEDLLELSRIGRLMNPPEVVPMGELVADALALLQGPLEDKGVKTVVHPELPAVRGDRTRLLEVLQNLIDNAVKYMGDQAQPRIEIGVRQEGNEAVCFVRDNGIGIEPRFHQKVFGLFDQLDPSAGGTGIGLALVKRIVEVHGGRIWIESKGVGHGSTFCFTIPSRPESEHGDSAPVAT